MAGLRRIATAYARQPETHAPVFVALDGRVVKFTLRPRFAGFGGPAHGELKDSYRQNALTRLNFL
jgi:hypothetical protein